MSSLQDAVTELYHEWLQDRESAEKRGVFKKSEAWTALSDAMQDRVRKAVLDDPVRAAPDIEQIARDMFNRADEALTDQGDREIRATAAGQESLPFNRLSALVALGKGDRVMFGDMRADEHRRADERHYKNLRDVQNAYDEWRRAMDPYQDGWTRGLSVREIEAAKPKNDEPPEGEGGEDE